MNYIASESVKSPTGVISLMSGKKGRCPRDWQLLQSGRRNRKPDSISFGTGAASTNFGSLRFARIRPWCVYLLACSHLTCSQLDTPVSNYAQVTRITSTCVCIKLLIIILCASHKARAGF